MSVELGERPEAGEVPETSDRLSHPGVAAGLLALFTAAQAPDAALAQGVFWAHDLRHHYHPWRHWAAEQWARGQVPLWASDVGVGFPLMADGQAGALYPVNVALGLLLPSHFALTASLLLHAWWAAMGGWFLARSLGRSGAAALSAGVIVGGSGFMVGHLTYAGMHAVAAWAPWAFALSLRLGRGEGSRWAPAWGAAVACALLAGHPQLAAITLLGSLLVFLSQRPGPRAWLRAGLGAALGVGAAGAQLAASLELARHSARDGGVDAAFADIGALPPQELLNLALPRFWGWERPADIALSYMHKGPLYFGTGEAHWEDLIFLGLPALLLAGWALTQRAARGWWALVGLSLALMLGTPAWTLLREVPGFDYFRFPARFSLWLTLAVAALAAAGLDHLLSQGPSALQRLRRQALSLAGALVGGGLLGRLALVFVEPLAREVLGGALASRPGGAERVDAIVEGMAYNGTWGLLLPALGLLGVAALAELGRRGRLPKSRLAAGLAALVALDLLLSLWGYNPRVAPSLAGEPPSTAAVVTAEPGLHRATVVDRLQPPALDAELMSASIGLIWGTRDVIVPSPLRLPGHEALLAAGGLDVGLDAGPKKAADLMARLHIASLLGVRHVLTVHRLEHPALRLVHEGAEGVRVYENAEALPRAWVVGCPVEVASQEEALSRLLELDPRTHAVVEGSLGLECRPDAPGRALVRLYDARRVELSYDAPQGGLLVLADSFYPGWTATLNGAPAELLRADVSLRGVALPPGSGELVFSYRPTWTPALPLAAGCWLVLGLGLVWGARARG